MAQFYGFRSDVAGFRQKMAKNYFAVYVMETKDELMREFSFDEEAMKQAAKEKYAEIANGSIEIKTLDSCIKKYKQILAQAERQAT